MTTIEHKGRTFTLVGTEPYTRRNGTPTSLNIWHTACAHPGCKNPCVVRTPGESPHVSKAFGLIHCKEHALPMAEVRRRGAVSQCKQRAKVSDAEVAKIRELAELGLTASFLAQVYPIKAATIRQIIAGTRR